MDSSPGVSSHLPAVTFLVCPKSQSVAQKVKGLCRSCGLIRQSLFCATAASASHPSGAAHAKPAACPFLMTERSSAQSATREESVTKGERRTARRPTPRSGDAPCRLASPCNIGSDTATPSRATTSALCRQKCVRRHKTPRDRMNPPRQNSPSSRRHHVDKSATPKSAKKNIWPTWPTWPPWPTSKIQPFIADEG